MSKKDGVVYTPVDVVEKMLDMVGYNPMTMPGFLDMDFMDNSCGDGNILVVALERACAAIDKITTSLGFGPKKKYNYFKDGLTKHFHGMELSANECAKCIDRLNKVVGNYLCQPVEWQWDIRCGDSLTASDDRKFDFVVCNPPYIRVHDLESNLEGYEFVEQGMKDMYLAFYELGLRQLKRNGKMCYITPSSWFTSTAGKKLRKYLFNNRLISEIYDYGHKQVFENATTYVEITVIDMLNSRHYYNGYVIYGSEELGDKKLAISYPAIELDGKFYFTSPSTILILSDICLHHRGKIRVKNGFATLADSIFIMDEKPCNSKYVIPIIKSSTGKSSWCIYPYDENNNLVEEYVLGREAPEARDWLLDNKGKLLDRDTDYPWYAFGRTQAINDTYKDKWVIKSIIKTVDDIKPIKAPAGTGTYGGLYILCEDESQLDCLKTEEFMNYVRSLKKYKSGGYYTFSSKDLENYLNWFNYGKKEREDNGI